MNGPLGLALVFGLLAAAPQLFEGKNPVVKLHVGEQRVLTARCKLQRLAVDASPVGGLQRIAIGDASVADVRTIGNNQILLIGGSRGKTTILVWCSNGQRFSILVEVVAGQPPSAPTPVKVKQTEEAATVVDERGARDTQVTVVEFPGELHDVTEVVSADGGLSFVGYDAAGLKVTITAVPYRVRDAGVRRDGG